MHRNTLEYKPASNMIVRVGMSVFTHFYLQNDEFDNYVKAAIAETVASKDYEYLRAQRDHWYCDPHPTGVRAVSKVWDQASLETFLSQPQKSSTGMVTCKHCLTSVSIFPTIYAEDHLALWCIGISCDDRKQFYH